MAEQVPWVLQEGTTDGGESATITGEEKEDEVG